MSNNKNFLLIATFFICSLVNGQIDTLSQVNKIIPINLLSALYSSDINELKLFCLDDGSIECKEGKIYETENMMIKTPKYVVLAEFSNKIFDNKKTIWRFYLKFADIKDEQLFLNLFPTHAGYHLNGDTYHRGFMQTIAIRDFYKTGKMMIEVWLYYPPLE